MNKIKAFLKKELMLTVSVAAAILSLFITKPSTELLSSIDWKTLATLFMLLSVLDGFKKENLFLPVIKITDRFKTTRSLSFFFVFSVFFSSMFVTNDVSLIIFVPLTIMLFRSGNSEQYTVPVLVLENIAAVRGSLLTPFGSPQNLFLFGKSQMSAVSFMLMMSPIWISSMAVLSLFILFLFRKEPKKEISSGSLSQTMVWEKERKTKRIVYVTLFVLIITSIVTRTTYWPYVTLFVTVMLLIFDRNVFRRVDYALLLTFFCFFVFSSSVAANPAISGFLRKTVNGNEYWASILLSQVISNVPASIVLWPFSSNLRALLYGLDSAGLVTIIGSLASVINLRIYSREYPGKTGYFMKEFEIISLAFFAIFVIPQFLYVR